MTMSGYLRYKNYVFKCAIDKIFCNFFIKLRILKNAKQKNTFSLFDMTIFYFINRKIVSLDFSQNKFKYVNCGIWRSSVNILKNILFCFPFTPYFLNF